jgi:DNA polymerase elongation subunit (family B)
MSYGYEALAKAVVDWIVSQGYNERILCLDLETKVLSRKEFLTNERILAISLARRIDTKVETEVLVLQEETDEAEESLIARFDEIVRQIRPLILLGYNVSSYDIPLLTMKLRMLPKPYWGIKDLLERSFILDTKYPVSFELANRDKTNPKIVGLDKVVNHPRFSHLPLMRSKNMLTLNGEIDKGVVIYELWKHQREDFVRYAKGDVHDVLIIFEELYGMNSRKMR